MALDRPPGPTWTLGLTLALATATGGTAQQGWVDRTVSRRSHSAIAYDAARQRVVLFGGWPNELDDTWEWDGARWSRRDPRTRPPGRFGHAMVYDAARQLVVLFGGQRGFSVHLDDTWAWDGVDWRRLPDLAAPPSGRSLHAMAFDTRRDRIVLFGGRPSGGDETWEHDGRRWTARRPRERPPALSHHAMAFDAARGAVVLYGGVGVRGNATGTTGTWTWDGTDWTHRRPNREPPVREGAGMVWDPAQARVVMFGGRAIDTILGDVWQWDGAGWTEVLAPGAGTGTLRRYAHAMTYDRARQRTVVFAGSQPPRPGGWSARLAGDTWSFDGRSFARIGASPTPDVDEHALAYDARRRRIVLVGALETDDASGLWEWDGTRWSLRARGGPSARRGHAVAYDTRRGRLVLFGGISNRGDWARHTWEWDGSRWHQRAVTGPSSRAGHAMVYDAGRGRTVLFGGTRNGDATWEWDGVTWMRRDPPTIPPIYYGHAIAYDPLRRRVVVFGGSGPDGEPIAQTWEWDGMLWRHARPVASPPPVVGHGMVYDPVRRRVVAFGMLTGLWEWDGTSWTTRPSATAVPWLGGRPIAYDTARGRLVAVGRRAPAVWEYGPVHRPAVVAFSVGCPGTAGVPRLASGGTAPRPGARDFALTLRSAMPQSIASLVVSTAARARDLGDGCRVYPDAPGAEVVAAAAIVGTDAAGRARQPLPIPPEPGLLGLRCYAQAAVVDPRGPFVGLAFSDAVVIRIGE